MWSDLRVRFFFFFFQYEASSTSLSCDEGYMDRGNRQTRKERTAVRYEVSVCLHFCMSAVLICPNPIYMSEPRKNCRLVAVVVLLLKFSKAGSQ